MDDPLPAIADMQTPSHLMSPAARSPEPVNYEVLYKVAVQQCQDLQTENQQLRQVFQAPNATTTTPQTSLTNALRMSFTLMDQLKAEKQQLRQQVVELETKLQQQSQATLASTASDAAASQLHDEADSERDSTGDAPTVNGSANQVLTIDSDDDVDDTTQTTNTTNGSLHLQSTEQDTTELLSPHEDDIGSGLTSPTSPHDSSTAPTDSLSHTLSSTITDLNLTSASLSDIQTTNRLTFTADSPVFRQKLNIQRVRVAQMFARLDALADNVRQFSHATMSYSKAAEKLSAELQRSWEDIEVGEESFVTQMREQEIRDMLSQQALDSTKNSVTVEGVEAVSDKPTTDSENLTTTDCTTTVTEPKSPTSAGASSLNTLLETHTLPTTDVCTLQYTTSKLATLIQTTSQISANLALFLDHILLTSLTSIGETYREPCKHTLTSMEYHLQQYEQSLTKRLLTLRKTRERKMAVSNIFGKKRLLDEEMIQLALQQREMELKRLDHTVLLNHILTAKRLELVDTCNATFYAFITYFHEGEFQATAVRPEVDVSAAVMQARRVWESLEVERVKLQRTALQKSALPIDMNILFPHTTDTTFPSPTDDPSLTKPTTMQGYLRFPHPNPKLKGQWKRRWFILHSGQFYYLRESAYLQPKFITNVLTCTARQLVNSELDWCFEVITPAAKYTYQAENESDVKKWCTTFANSIEALLTQQTSRSDITSLVSALDIKHLQALKDTKAQKLSALRHLNTHCADCMAVAPDWASINLGIMICIVCSGIHRSLGVHISKVRSMMLDDWDIHLLEMMSAIGNKRSNAVYEATLPVEYRKPHANDGREIKEEFIRQKYVQHRWLRATLSAGDASSQQTSSPLDEEQVHQHVINAIQHDDVTALLIALPHGLAQSINTIHPQLNSSTYLHLAAQHDSVKCVEFLIQNNAELSLKDGGGCTALEVAKQRDTKQVETRLSSGASSNQASSGLNTLSSPNKQ